MEPRARAARHKSSLNFPDDLTTLLYGAGAPSHPDLSYPLADGSSSTYLRNLSATTANKTHPPTPYSKNAGETSLPIPYPETLRVLDEIVTDYIIETSHAALQVATYAGRAKLKYSDFEFVMRRDRRKLGRVQEMMTRQKKLKEARKGAGIDAGGGGEGVMADLKKMGVKDLQDLGDIVGEEGTGRGRGKGRGRRKKRVAEEMEGNEHEADEGQGRGGAEGSGIGDDLGDIDVDIDNDLEGIDDEVRHRTKRAKSGHD